MEPRNLPPLVTTSIALHGVAAALLAWQPASWPWAVGLVVADHAALTGAGLWPRSRLLGPNWTRLPESKGAPRVALTIDDGPHPEVTPRVLDLLDASQARATFFCIGELVSRHAALSREIVARGHSIQNHSQRHLKRFSVLGPGSMRREVADAQATIHDAIGRRPRFFRAPAGLRNPFLDGVLRSVGLELVSWTRRGFDTVNGRPEVVLARLTRGLTDGDILLLHDGHAAATTDGSPVVLDALPRLLAAFREAGLATVTLEDALP